MPQSELREFIIDFGLDGNSEAFTAEGWSNPELAHRWTVGTHSKISIPPLPFLDDVLITFCMSPHIREPRLRFQRIWILVNGHVLDEFTLNSGLYRYAILIQDQAILCPTGNIITILHPDAARPSDFGAYDDRELAVAMRTVTIDRSHVNIFGRPELLPVPSQRTNGEVLANMGARFQSLGQNCEFGLFQRRCGAEPLGLLRFASITISRLQDGISSGFVGIGDPNKLRFSAARAGAEYIGHHELYGLDYHTFRNEGSVDLKVFQMTECRRLQFLARLLIEQITDGDKIFVVQRSQPPLALREVLSLLQLLRVANPRTALLWVTEANVREHHLIGRVELIGPLFFHGYLDRLAPAENAHDLSSQCWLDICLAVTTATDDPRTDPRRVSNEVSCIAKIDHGT